MALVNLFGQRITKRPGGKKGYDILGCDVCPQNNAPGVRKVLGLDRIRGRKVFAWAMCPGRRENDLGMELVGPSGQLLWRALQTVGLSRSDVDVQNVLRCRPVGPDGRDRDPDKRELQCCSVYNDDAIRRNRGRAVVHLILGDVAGAQLLGGAFRKDVPVFWHDLWNAYVVLAHHPSYILRKGGEKAGGEYRAWLDRMRAVVEIRDHPGKWGVARAQDNRVVRTVSDLDAMEKALRAEARAKRRVSVDVEDGRGHSKLLLTGFGTGRWRDPKDLRSWDGTNWTVVMDHPEAGYETSHRRLVRERVKRIVEDATIKKTLQNGSYDSKIFDKLLGAKLRGYEYDTMYGTYLRFSYLRSCSLENLAYRFFPEFGDYKDATAEWPDFYDAPLDRLALRNCTDVGVTQRLEQRFSPQVPQALVEVYIHAGFTLDAMEGRGPLLDWKQWEVANAEVPGIIAQLDRALRQHPDAPEGFDVDSPKQVAEFVYDRLKMPVTDAGRSTVKEVLELLQAQTGESTLDLIGKRRVVGKIKSTYLDGFAASARKNAGELRTIWWLTGAVTGRLRSGKGDRAEAEGVLNMQNLHGNPLLQNMIVSDLRWRDAL